MLTATAGLVDIMRQEGMPYLIKSGRCGGKKEKGSGMGSWSSQNTNTPRRHGQLERLGSLGKEEVEQRERRERTVLEAALDSEIFLQL